MSRWRLGCIAFLALGLWACGGAQYDIAGPEFVPKTVVVSQLAFGEEDDGYGLYSYLLYRTTPQSEGRDLALFKELLKHPTAEGSDLPLATLNLTAVPQRAESSPPPADAGTWIERYDLERSVKILTIQQIAGPGPFLVSCKYRLGVAESKRHVAILDLSGATTAESATAWVKYFVDVSETPEAWATNDAELVLLHIHDKMALVGSVVDVLPDGDKILKAIGL